MSLYVYFTIPTFVSEHFADAYDESPLQANSDLQAEPRRAEPSQELEPEKTHNSPSTPAKTNLKGRLKLPQYVIDRVKTFVFFLGYPHSGHSIVGSLMDGHPQIVISNELDLFTKLAKRVIAPNKTAIFDAIWKKHCTGYK